MNDLKSHYQKMLSNYKGGLSNTSTSKFDDIVSYVAEKFGLNTEDVYATGSGTRPGNLEVRLSQGVRATVHTVLGLGFMVDEKGTEENRKKLTESAMVTVTKFLGRGKANYDNIALFVESEKDLFPMGLIYKENSTIADSLISEFGFTITKSIPLSSIQSNTSSSLEPSIADYVTKYDNQSFTKDELLKIFKEIYDKTVERERISDENTFGIQYCNHLIGLGINCRAFAKEALGSETADSIGDEISRGVKLGERLRKHLTVSHVSSDIGASSSAENYDKFLRALRTKPFLLLAGISGTGKSRIVRELAFKSCPVSLQDADGTTPGNYLMVEVKPNWHDSSELLGYYSNLKPGYIYTDFIKFAAKATQYPDVPFFVCLDEMNLAPVEQYFAEFLSILETRKAVSGKILSGEMVSADNMNAFPGWPAGKALTLPDNLFVIGTVNMDDTTHQFSRKVIDRAMTIEMNGGDLSDMFGRSQDLEYLPASDVWKLNSFAPEYVTADEALDKHPAEAEQMRKDLTERLQAINTELENTPFQVSYRVLNELCIYTAVLLDDGFAIDEAIEEAVDQIALMKILPRIEGDEDLFSIRNENVNKLDKLKGLFNSDSESWKKLDEMNKRLGNGGGFTRFWP